MEYKVLYRKYRPDKFNDVVGQDPIITILKNSVIGNKIGHAYLFSGSRGTGKTSVAKILSKAANCMSSVDGERCGKCEVCKKLTDNEVDIIEIDAASNNGVDEIREIRNNAKLLPNIGKYKVYIIDEAHMLSSGAFNALLKTLEEPPNHVIFILATTEIQKIPLTILSRCQKFEFKKITKKDILKRLKFIAKKEKIKISDEALEIISELGDGGLRDAINMLDQVSSDNAEDIKIENIYEITGIVSTEKTKEFLDYVKANNTKKVLDFIEKLSESGKNYKLFCERLIEYIRTNLIEQNIKENKLTDSNIDITLIRSLITLISELKTSLNQKILFEITMLEVMEKLQKLEEKQNAPVIVEINNKEISPIKEEKEETKEEEQLEEIQGLVQIRINNALAKADKKILNELQEKHDGITNYISNKKFNNVANMLLNCKLIIASDTHLIYEANNKSAVIIFKNNLDLIEELLDKIYKKQYKVGYLTKSEWEKEKKKYMENRKKKIKYEIIDETKYLESKEQDEELGEFEKNAINLFGKETIKKS